MTQCNPPPEQQAADDTPRVQRKCIDCGADMSMRAKSWARPRCPECKHEKQKKAVRDSRQRKKLGLPTPVRSKVTETDKEDPREYGPARPLLFMDAREYSEWRNRRAVRLYQEEGLGTSAIAERLGVARSCVHKALEAAGVALRDENNHLPAGLPL